MIMAQYRHSDTDDTDREAEIRWELKAIEEGARKAREQMASKSIAESTPGRQLMKRAVVPLAKEIRRGQDEAYTLLTEKRSGPKPAWCVPMMLINAEKLAVIVVSTIFDATPKQFTPHYPISRIAVGIHHAAYTQVDYDQWEQNQKDIRKETGQVTDLDNYLRHTKNIDKKSFDRFTWKIKRARAEKWPYEIGIHFGVKCLDFLVKSNPDWFEIRTNRTRNGKYETQLMLSQDCRNLLVDLMEQEELRKPRMLPMIKPPKPWKRKDT